MAITGLFQSLFIDYSHLFYLVESSLAILAYTAALLPPNGRSVGQSTKMESDITCNCFSVSAELEARQ